MQKKTPLRCWAIKITMTAIRLGNRSLRDIYIFFRGKKANGGGWYMWVRLQLDIVYSIILCSEIQIDSQNNFTLKIVEDTSDNSFIYL